MLIYQRVTIINGVVSARQSVWTCRSPSLSGFFEQLANLNMAHFQMIYISIEYGDLWWFMVIYGDLWWFMVIYGDLWWFMVISHCYVELPEGSRGFFSWNLRSVVLQFPPAKLLLARTARTHFDESSTFRNSNCNIPNISQHNIHGI